MRLILTLSLTLLAAPAFGQDCFYENWLGDRAVPGFAALSIEYANGDSDYCPSIGVGTGLPYRLAECESGFSGIYSFAPSSLVADDDAILIFQDNAWYNQCSTD